MGRPRLNLGVLGAYLRLRVTYCNPAKRIISHLASRPSPILQYIAPAISRGRDKAALSAYNQPGQALSPLSLKWGNFGSQICVVYFVQEGVLSRPAFMFCTLVAQTRHAAILVVPSAITNAACAFTSTVERRPCQLQLQLHKCPCPTSGILNSRSFPNATLNAKTYHQISREARENR